jgi:hypothetical protein
MLDRFMSDQYRPWSHYNLSNHLGDYDELRAKQRQIFAEVSELAELADLSDEQSSWPILCRVDYNSLLDSSSAIDNERGDETPEAAILSDLSGLSVQLAEYQDSFRLDSYSEETLKLARLLKPYQKQLSYTLFTRE